MKYEIVEHPVKHIIIRNFLSEEELIEVEKELNNLYHAMYEGEWFSAEKGRYVDHDVKKCLNLNLFSHYQEQSNLSYMIEHVLKEKMWTDEMRDMYDSCGNDSVFSHLNETDANYTMLAGFRDGDYYKWHGDFGMVTTNIMVSRSMNFEGGDFVLSNRLSKDRDKIIGEKLKTIRYKYEPGMLIMFPARFDHMVSKVKTKSNNLKDIRFTLQDRCGIFKY